MASITDAPCRVSAELRKYQREQDQYVPEEFDWCNESHMKAIFGDHPALIKAISGLLESYHAIDHTERAYGKEYLDWDKAKQWLTTDLLRLREACGVLFVEER